MRRLVIVFFAIVVNSFKSNSQDVHFSQFYFSPLTVNPALTGVFNGDLRLSANYRDQWETALQSAAYRTYSGAMDFSLRTGVYNHLGIGMYFMSDRAGTSQLGTNYYELSLAYDMIMNQKKNYYLAVGLQVGYAQSSINLANLTFGTQWANNSFNPLLPNGENLYISSTSYVDASAGVLLYHLYSERKNIYFGLSAFHLNLPVVSFENSIEGAKIPMKYNANMGFETTLGHSADIIPMALASVQGDMQEVDAGVLFKFIISTNANNSLNAFSIGPLYRVVGGAAFGNSDAVIAAFRLDLGGLSFGLSYDVNISQLTPATNYQGGPELAIQYIIGHSKTPYQSFCPHW